MRKPGDLDGNDFCFVERARPVDRASGKPPRAVIDPAGRRWVSLSAAARAYRLTYQAVKHRIVAGTSGWRLAEQPELPEPHRGRLIILLTRAAWLAKAQGRTDDAERLLSWARAVRDEELP